MQSSHTSRRRFLLQASLSGALLSGNNFTQPEAPGSAETEDNFLRVSPRYHRWHVDPGVPWLETNTGYHHLQWKIPLAQAALVLIDVWQRHYLKDTEERTEQVMDRKLVPLVQACRQSGLAVIHAPSAPVARLHPNWLSLSGAPSTVRDAEWPPADFRSLTGAYKTYRRPDEPREKERQALPPLRIHPKVSPVAGEAVIATGDELHRYCKQKGILFLFFAGFNTNACVLRNDYATIKMSERGYQVLLVRDCTTGMESRETQPALEQTRAAILHLEMFGQYSVLSDEIRASLQKP